MLLLTIGNKCVLSFPDLLLLELNFGLKDDFN